MARSKPRAAVLSIAALLSDLHHRHAVRHAARDICLPAIGCRRCWWRSRTCDSSGACSSSTGALFGADGLARLEQHAPRALIEYLELAYLLCYAVVPAGYACLVLAGHGADAIDRFWSVVLLAGVHVLRAAALAADACATRRRAVTRQRRARRSRKLNLAVLNRASVQWNTFPSGHTAASLATALAVWELHAACRHRSGRCGAQHRRRQRRRPLSLCG